ncbi:unannotated protein [freshwater metagenome]|uniref:Unannotated protein n=1 Tax=freshwater metagenome TaxID=449393 RepID=A0A6J5YJ31_9ZZZZ
MSKSSPMRASNTNEPAPSEYDGGTGIHHDVATPKCRAVMAMTFVPGFRCAARSTMS